MKVERKACDVPALKNSVGFIVNGFA